MNYLERLQAAGLPVLYADETGVASMGKMTIEQEHTFQNITLEYFQPQAYADLLDQRALIQALKDEYTTAIQTLQTIQNTANPSNAQVIAAVKYEAKTLERILKLIKGQFMG